MGVVLVKKADGRRLRNNKAQDCRCCLRFESITAVDSEMFLNGYHTPVIPFFSLVRSC